jgi:hypothetical protein
MIFERLVAEVRYRRSKHATVKDALLRLAATEDAEYYLHLEDLVKGDATADS